MNGYSVDWEGYTTIGALRRALGAGVRGMIVRRHPSLGKTERLVLLKPAPTLGGILVKCVGDGEEVDAAAITDDDGKLQDGELVKVEE
ncbi:MAG: hypothetical protein UX44_C0024G0012 [candidate division WWE3 bacterium GW2011_GWA1_46_21]|uniref:Uncharacterized protein n=1 Tax=candidate division WWE3 bacterium GW2011_GWA1_46_21 TaxID=1619107 RepID=A0A0G1PCH6_UNCKA|nr:MAG: hypothetical protein UX44_C0024G0012 [candidate division WWE3 bacterium GW2011_GWA1_46_21]